MMKLKNLQYRSLWYKKIFYYLQAGQSISESIRTAGDDLETHLLYEYVQTGQRMSVVCKEYFEDIFSFIEISLLNVGEKTGTSKEICLLLSGLLKSQYIQKQKVIGAAIYPIIVLCLAFGLLILILTIIVPKIGPLFSEMTSLPLSTEILIGASKHVTAYWWVDVLMVLAGVLVYMVGRKHIAFQRWFGRIKNIFFARTPYLKDLYILWHLEKWIHTICVCLESRMPLYESIKLANEAVSDSFMQSEFKKVAQAVEGGKTCADSLILLAPRVYKKLKGWESVIRSGEQTGSILDVFVVCHDDIRSSLSEAFERAQKFVEPALIVGVGMMVLGICLSIILPMYQLTQSLNQ